MIFIDGVTDDRVDALDRGLHYGDGLFETIAYKDGCIEFLECHLNRLMSGCVKLNIAFDRFSDLRCEIHSLCHEASSDAVIKVIVTRGASSRGYLAPKGTIPTRIVSTYPYPNDVHYYNQQGIRARICQHRLSENSGLAGLKHLNRLDQVIARNEWRDKTIAEGFMLDSTDHVIEGTMSNIFIVSARRLITPKLDKSGIAGIIRSKIITLATEQNMPVKEASICQQTLRNAEEIFVCNSVMGIVPVIYINDYYSTYPVGTVTRKLQRLLEQLKN